MNCVNFISFTASFIILLMGCGSSPQGSPGIPSDTLSAEMTRVESQISICDTALGSFYSRPNCDMGDAWTLNAAMAKLHPEKAREFASQSIDTDGRPFRSPTHLQRFHAGEQGVDIQGSSFSRDHVMSLLFYTVWTKDKEPLVKVWGYAKSHSLMVCSGSVSQCLLTPAMLDQIGDVLAFVGEERPWQTHVPGAVSAVVQQASVPNISSWQLTLVAEHVLLKVVTGNSNSAWASLARQVSEKVPENLFYKYAYLASKESTKVEFQTLSDCLLKLMAEWKSPGHQWFYNDGNIKTATGVDLLLLGSLLEKGI